MRLKLSEIQLLGSSGFKCEHLGCDAQALYSLVFMRYTHNGASTPHYDRCTFHARQMAERYGAQLPEVAP